MKTCSNCGESKKATEFYSKKNSCKVCCNAASQKWRKENLSKKKLLNTEWYYKTTYNISYSEFLEACSKQHNKCKICNIDLTFEGKSNTSAVQDHDHTTGKLRYILCNSCNVALGHFKDSEEIILNALNYLRENKN